MDKLHDLESIRQFIAGNTFAFLYVSSEGCSVCRHLRPKVEQLLGQFPRVVSRWAEVSEVPALAGELSVFTVPVLLMFVDGKETIRESRYVNLQELESKVERYYSLREA